MTTPLQSYYIVRFSDCDPFGHLNNARYLDYMLNAREDHLRETYKLSLSDFAKQGVGWVTTRNEIQYVRPAFYNERVCIQSTLLETNETELLVEMVMFDESRQQLKAMLWCTLTHINIKTGRRETHAPETMHFLQGLVPEGADASEGFKPRLASLLTQLKESSNTAGIS
jgi:acyl-CoA thioester hydrolase